MNDFKYSSKQIADWTSRKHYHVLRTIRSELDKKISIFHKNNFVEGKYVDKCNNSRIAIYMNEMGLNEYCKLKGSECERIIRKFIDSKENVSKMKLELSDITFEEISKELLKLKSENEKLVKQMLDHKKKLDDLTNRVSKKIE